MLQNGTKTEVLHLSPGQGDPKEILFVLQLKSVEVDQDITEIELELGLSKKHSKNR